MEGVPQACPNSEGGEGLNAQVTALSDQILELLCTRLNKMSIMAMKKKLIHMERSSYYLEVEEEVPAEQQHPRSPPVWSRSLVWPHLDQRRLHSALAFARDTVKLHLSVLRILFEDILEGLEMLGAFVAQFKQGSVDNNAAASAQLSLQLTLQCLDDFESRICWSPSPLALPNKLTTVPGSFPPARFSASLAFRPPAYFDFFRTEVTSTSVRLYWTIEGEQSHDSNQGFEVLTQCLQPITEEHTFPIVMSRSDHSLITNLRPDTHFQFTLRRAPAPNFVFEQWSAIIILKTLEKPH